MASRALRSLVLRAAIALVPAGVAHGQAAAPPSPRGNQIKIPFERYTLPNGLTVVLSPDRSTPTAAIVLMYHVGSKNEKVGQTGFAHLFEHVMFTGSEHVPYGHHDRYTEGVGGFNNGGASNDFTIYFQSVPSNYVETVLWMEADRMGWMLGALDTAKYNAQRSIVQNERRERTDNVPYGRVDEIIDEALYPKTNPYRWPVSGYMADLQAAPVSAVKEFFQLYYAPGNATLVITGGFDVPETKQWIAKYFTAIPRGAPIARPTIAPVSLAREKRYTYEDRVQVPQLDIVWPTVGARSDDQYALDILGAILSGPRTARLTKELVFDRRWATGVQATQTTNELAGEFSITVTPQRGHTLTAIEPAVDSIVDRLKREGPTDDEVARAKAGNELQFLNGLQSSMGKAQQLAINQIFFQDPDHSFTTQYQKSQAVTAADVKRVANKYLTAGRVVLSTVPLGQRGQAAKADASLSVGSAETAVTIPPALENR